MNLPVPVAGLRALIRERNPDLDAEAIARRIVKRSAALCGTALRQVDALAALLNAPSPATSCR